MAIVMKKLNLGCGYDIREGWVNLDSSPLTGVDVVHNIEDLPLPFESEAFDLVVAKDVLEHVEYIDVLGDLNRIIKAGGKLIVQVPHFSSVSNYIDPTHKKRFSIQTFDFFVKGLNQDRIYYFDFSYERVFCKRLTFLKGVYFYNYLVEKIVNFNDRTLKVYETTGLCRLFPAQNIYIELIK